MIHILTALPCILRTIKNYELRILWVLRKYQDSAGFLHKIWKAFLFSYKRKYGIELVYENIDGGLRLIHPLYKGVTIGIIEKGKTLEIRRSRIM